MRTHGRNSISIRGRWPAGQERGRTKAKVVTRLGWITIGNNNKEAAALRRTLKAAALKLGASRGNQPGHLRGRESGNIYCTTDVSVIGTRRISTAQHTHVNTPLHGAITLLWCAPAGRAAPPSFATLNKQRARGALLCGKELG